MINVQKVQSVMLCIDIGRNRRNINKNVLSESKIKM